MSDDPILVLERELVMAARRRSLRPARLRRLRARPVAGAVALLVPVLAVIAALSLTGTPDLGTPAATSRPLTLTGGTGHPAPRPATLGSDQPGAGDRAGEDRAGAAAPVQITPGSRIIPLELIVSRKATRAGPQQLSAFATTSTSSPTRNSSFLFFTSDVNAQQLHRRGIVMPLGRWAVVAIVPDGVASVGFVLRGSRRPSLDKRAAVGENVTAVAIPPGYRAAPALVTWYDRHGRTVRQIRHPQ